MSRRVQLLLTLCLLLTTSCTSGNSTETTADTDVYSPIQETTVQEETKDILSTLPEKNFDGAEYKILCNIAPGWYTDNHLLFAEEITGEPLNDAMYNRDEILETTYNVDMVYNIQDYTAFKLQNSITAGDPGWHQVYSLLQNGAFGEQSLSGILMNLYDLPYINPTEKWWSRSTSEALTLHDTLYFTTGDIAPIMTLGINCMYVNLNVLQNNGYKAEELYQTIRSGKWTYDEMFDMSITLNQDLNQDGKMDKNEDFFGCFMVYNSTNNIAAFMINGGVDLCSRNDEGNLSVNLFTGRTVSVIETLQRNVPENTLSDAANNPFTEDRCLFYAQNIQSAYFNFREMDSDYTILPMPKFDLLQEDYRSAITPWLGGYTAVPTNCPDTEIAGFMMEAAAMKSYDIIRPAFYDVVLDKKLARNDETREMLDIVMNNYYIDFNVFYNIGGSVQMLSDVVNGDKEFASAWNSIEVSVNKEVERINAIYKGQE